MSGVSSRVVPSDFSKTSVSVRILGRIGGAVGGWLAAVGLAPALIRGALILELSAEQPLDLIDPESSGGDLVADLVADRELFGVVPVEEGVEKSRELPDAT